MQLEPLESRRLLATTLVNGILEVTGTHGADTISIDNCVVVIGIGQPAITKIGVTINGIEEMFPFDGVNGIDIHGGAGNDSIEISGLNLPTTLRGGQGDDSITAADIGGDALIGGSGDDHLAAVDIGGHDTLRGGAGNDRLEHQATPGSAVILGTGPIVVVSAGPSVFKGGPGNDTLNAGDDGGELFGGAGADSLTGGAGTDGLYGGPGRDTLDLGIPLLTTPPADNHLHDTILGGNGNDVLYRTGGAALVDGGRGDNQISTDGPPDIIYVPPGGPAPI